MPKYILEVLVDGDWLDADRFRPFSYINEEHVLEEAWDRCKAHGGTYRAMGVKG